MTYDETSIQVLNNAVEMIRKRPEMYVGACVTQPEFLPGFLATSLASDAIYLGVTQVEIRRIDDWWTVASDEDWLTYRNSLGVRETFNRILPFPGMVNSHRSEVLIHAFASSAFTTRAGALVVVSGDEAAIRGMLAHGPFGGFGSKRVVAFSTASCGPSG
jgi:hypothetical protein